MTFSGALLTAINGFEGSIDVYVDLAKLEIVQLSDSFTKDAHHVQ